MIEVVDKNRKSLCKVPEKGKRYKVRSVPYTHSYIEIEEHKDGEWMYMPIDTTEDLIYTEEKYDYHCTVRGE